MIKATRDFVLIALATMLLLELALRVHNPIFVPLRSDNIQLPVSRVFTQRNTNNPKVDEYQTYAYNSIGLRGPELPDSSDRLTRIFTVGGSTTACVQLTDGRTWPDQLLSRLQQKSGSVWLNNAGQNGHSTFGHLILLERHLKKFRPDLVIYLVGINDVARSDLNTYDATMIGKDAPLRNRIVASSELLSTVQVLKRSYMAYDLGVNTFHPLDIESVGKVSTRPAIAERELALHRESYLSEFRKRLEVLVLRTRDAGGKAIFMTQPALYGRGVDRMTGVPLDNLETPRKGLPSYLEWEVLELYNDVTREVARANELPLIDLAKLLPKDSKYFFDWIHYSNVGAERVAEIVANALIELALVPASAAE